MPRGSMNRLGLIPAAGEASRWNGTMKELLPIGEEGSLLSRTIAVMERGAARPTMIVTSPRKATSIFQHLAGRHEGIGYVLQSDKSRDVWGAIRESFAYNPAWTLYAMPDTYVPLDAFYRKMTSDFMLGVFRTDKAERFGVINALGTIDDKPERLAGTKQWAWGVLAWSRRVVDFWKAQDYQIESHTDAFNQAIQKFGCESFKLDYYYDISNWSDYEELITNVLPLHG